jgi:hypothetical protein
MSRIVCVVDIGVDVAVVFLAAGDGWYCRLYVGVVSASIGVG